MTSERPRVSAETVDLICGRAERDEAAGEATTMQMIVLDARADLQRVMAENANLRAALATARRDGWIAGRDAAAECVDQYLREYGLTFSWHRDEPEAIRALAPDTAEGE